MSTNTISLEEIFAFYRDNSINEHQEGDAPLPSAFEDVPLYYTNSTQ